MIRLLAVTFSDAHATVMEKLYFFAEVFAVAMICKLLSLSLAAFLNCDKIQMTDRACVYIYIVSTTSTASSQSRPSFLPMNKLQPGPVRCKRISQHFSVHFLCYELRTFEAVYSSVISWYLLSCRTCDAMYLQPMMTLVPLFQEGRHFPISHLSQQTFCLLQHVLQVQDVLSSSSFSLQIVDFVVAGFTNSRSSTAF